MVLVGFWFWVVGFFFLLVHKGPYFSVRVSAVP